MEDTEFPLSTLLGAIGILALLSAFFSGSETAMMALNRYRLAHLVKDGQLTPEERDELKRLIDEAE